MTPAGLEIEEMDHFTLVGTRVRDHVRPARDDSRLPRLWRATGEVRGEPIPIGTTLVRVGASQAAGPGMFGWGNWESTSLVLQALDGARAGDVFAVSTHHEWFDEQFDALNAVRGGPDDPRWPTGIVPDEA